MDHHVETILTTKQLEKISADEKTGATVIYASWNRTLCGVFIVSDRVRIEAAEAVALLKRAGLSIAMVTGDNLPTALAVAHTVGIDSVKANTSPVDKAAEIRRMEGEGKHVLMAGDGINDAPALVQASVGVAMGRATDIALESADMVVMRPDLRLVADAVTLSKKTFSIIRQNIFWAFFYNMVVIPLAVTGVMHPVMAAGAMVFSSLTVIGNSLRARLRT
jgi:P-type E1-E2 ATPase